MHPANCVHQRGPSGQLNVPSFFQYGYSKALFLAVNDRICTQFCNNPHWCRYRLTVGHQFKQTGHHNMYMFTCTGLLSRSPKHDCSWWVWIVNINSEAWRRLNIQKSCSHGCYVACCMSVVFYYLNLWHAHIYIYIHWNFRHSVRIEQSLC